MSCFPPRHSHPFWLTKTLLCPTATDRDEQGQPISRQGLRDHVLNAIIAGRDTTAQALSWTMFRLMSSDPSLLATLREEVDRLGELTYDSYKVRSTLNFDSLLSFRSLSLRDMLMLHFFMLQEFVQVQAAFNEGLRLQ